MPSPDERCAVRYIQTQGEGWNAQTRGEIECSWENGGFGGEEFVRVFSADVPLPLRWRDANTLEVGIPKDGHFTPLRAKSEHFGHTINYVYRPMSRDEMGPLECFENIMEHPANLRLLSGAAERPVNAPGWITYGSEQTCILGGIARAPAHPLIDFTFKRTATRRLPFGTTELVLIVYLPHGARAPRIRLSTDEAPLVAQPNGVGSSYRLVGAPAERVLRQQTRGTEVELLFKDSQTVDQSITLPDENFIDAHAAFQTCVRALPPASGSR